MIFRLADKHMVMLDDDLADALVESYASLKRHVTETSGRESQVKVWYNN